MKRHFSFTSLETIHTNLLDLADLADSFDQLAKIAEIGDILNEPGDKEHKELFSQIQKTARHLKGLPAIGALEFLEKNDPFCGYCKQPHELHEGCKNG